MQAKEGQVLSSAAKQKTPLVKRKASTAKQSRLPGSASEVNRDEAHVTFKAQFSVYYYTSLFPTTK